MSEHGAKPQTINVTVTYPAARKPFEQKDAPPSETVGALKGMVLEAFGLTEGTSPDGNTTTTYTLYHEKDALKDLNQTLGDIAGNAGALHLKLAQQITQG